MQSFLLYLNNFFLLQHISILILYKILYITYLFPNLCIILVSINIEEYITIIITKLINW